ncbi:sensor histidine kinase [Sporosarcina sp. YIM B06819]|uniref:sensor histidine kinase n=1 Tax=Sporosarcina sp. YIM B06819 TaxID=3081769 RepID=UPI00298C0F40|nr:sensor histidine kinase [Sporosarcina sp. YIM B06819]
MKIKKQGRPNTQNIFNKLFLISSITIITTVIILIVTITNYYSDIIIQKEVNISTRTLERVEDYFSAKDADINRAMKELYSRGDMIDDISYALHNGYGEYMEYRLDKFSENHSFTPSNIEIYFTSYFSHDSDLNAISLSSLEYPAIEYLLINNQTRWRESIVAKTTKNDLFFGMHNVYTESLPNIRKFKNTIIKKIDINNPVTLKKIGEISFYYSTEQMDEMLNRHEGAPASYFLLDNEGTSMYALNKGVPLSLIEKVSLKTNETKIKWQRENYYINTIANSGDFTYVSVIPDKGWTKLMIVRGTMWIVITLLIAVAILISYSFTYNYSRRITTIISTIRQVENGNLHARIPESKHDDELSKIAVNINSMLAELNNYIEQFYVLNLKQQHAELKALQAQIDPHFLFNTLEAIRMVAVMEGSKTSAKMTFHLSKLFRYSLESKDTVPLYTEIEYLNQYISLMQFKFPNKLQVYFDIPSDMEQIMVQKLILQPIIENYFIHGFKKGQSDNTLIIRAVNLGDMMTLRVEDNGKGMTEVELSTILRHINRDEGDEMKSIGLRNIHQRLKLKYGDQFGISLKSIKDQGTIVTLSIPVQGNYHV